MVILSHATSMRKAASYNLNSKSIGMISVVLSMRVVVSALLNSSSRIERLLLVFGFGINVEEWKEVLPRINM